MNSFTSLRDRSTPPTPSRTSADATPQVATPLSEAANEDLFWNPLWLVAFGMVGLFVILACLTSS